jgi:transaldolase
VPTREPAAVLRVARELARRVDRPNLLVKLPATGAGLAAATSCLAEGIGVHVTGVYTERLHRRVLAAHLDGLERAARAGVALARVASVAALPLAALDAEVDARLALSAPTGLPWSSAALATAGLMYEQLDRQLDGHRWRALRRAGAHPQRLLWSDTGHARRGTRPTHYVEELVGWGTVALMAPPLLHAFAMCGALRGDTLSGRAEPARTVLAELEVRGVDLTSAAQKLADDDDMRTRTTWLSLLSLVASGLGHR